MFTNGSRDYNYFRFDGFAIRRQKMSKPLCAWGFVIPGNRFWLICYSGITNPPVFIGRTFFTADFKSAGTDGALLTVKKNLRYLRNLRDFKKQQGCSDDFSVRNRL